MGDRGRRRRSGDLSGGDSSRGGGCAHCDGWRRRGCRGGDVPDSDAEPASSAEPAPSASSACNSFFFSVESYSSASSFSADCASSFLSVSCSFGTRSLGSSRRMLPRRRGGRRGVPRGAAPAPPDFSPGSCVGRPLDSDAESASSESSAGSCSSAECCRSLCFCSSASSDDIISVLVCTSGTSCGGGRGGCGDRGTAS